MLVASVVIFILKGAPLEGPLHTSPFDAFLLVVLVAAYFERVGAHVRQVARGLPDQPLQPTSGRGATVADSAI